VNDQASTTSCSAPGEGITIGELCSFVDLGIAQLEGAVREADTRVDRLAQSMVVIHAALDRMAERADQCPSHAPYSELIEQMREQVLSAVVSLQFYDKLIQRIQHVRDGLVVPVAHVDAPAEGKSPHWDTLLDRVRERYSMVEERVLFDFLMKGANADQMLTALTDLRGATNPGELELF
jgi:hypothetical protein